MKLKFDPSLEYQQDAIEAIVSAFDGQPLAQSIFEIIDANPSGMQLTELGVSNDLTIPDDRLLGNIQEIQEKNDIEQISELQGKNFTIEMETGTGKTYVYLRSIFELSKKYGFKKFIIVVPSVPIREGVLKSLEIMQEHFKTLYDNVPFNYFVYNSKKLGEVRQFAASNQIQIMVINIQSFQKDVAEKELHEMTTEELAKLNVINRENDKLSGRKPIEFIQDTNPIVIIDEPQSVDNTPKSKRAISRLNPLATMRYSATHKKDSLYNLLYKLDPIKAYDLKLVKRIEVASVRSEDSFNDAYVKLLKTDNKKGIKAQVEIHKASGGSPKPTKIWVKQGDDLYYKSGEREIYKTGYIVQNIDCTPGGEHLEFNQGKFLETGSEIGGHSEDIMKAQVYETVEMHFKKERALLNKDIKVLSLFFIDKVANYRVYNDDGTISLGKVGLWFEEAYKEISAKCIYKELDKHDVSDVHNGYFSQDKKGQAKDTKGNTKDDENTYSLIMRDKERLLSTDEPLRFIFSHSALREGWDNPNVFQICTLNETQSVDKKRQEIGRGLRLPVNSKGERVHEDYINRLTVIANESYEDFAKQLQTEFEDDCGITFGKLPKIAFAKIIPAAEVEEKPIGQAASNEIWKQVRDQGLIHDDGKILDTFDPKNTHFDLKITDEYQGIKAEIVDKISSYVFANRVPDAREKSEVKFNKKRPLKEDFKELWNRIKYKTRYRVKFDTEKLVQVAVNRIKEHVEPIKSATISTDRVELGMTTAGVDTDAIMEHKTSKVGGIKVLPDLLGFLQKETDLTRDTLVNILKGSGRLNEFQINPHQFMVNFGKEISRSLHEMMLNGIQYKKIGSESYEMQRIEQEAEEGITRYLNNLYKVTNSDKALFDKIEFNSEIEHQFAKDLDTNDNVKLFVKLPSWFKIDTPIGAYNPDWAFVTEREKKLYFVRETKSSLDGEDRRNKENQKIFCGKKHFETLGVDFAVVTKLSEVEI